MNTQTFWINLGAIWLCSFCLPALLFAQATDSLPACESTQAKKEFTVKVKKKNTNNSPTSSFGSVVSEQRRTAQLPNTLTPNPQPPTPNPEIPNPQPPTPNTPTPNPEIPNPPTPNPIPPKPKYSKLPQIRGEDFAMIRLEKYEGLDSMRKETHFYTIFALTINKYGKPANIKTLETNNPALTNVLYKTIRKAVWSPALDQAQQPVEYTYPPQLLILPRDYEIPQDNDD